MLTKEITYTDYDGNTRTETHRFNLTTTELMEMQVSVEGGLTKMIERITAAQDAKQIMAVFKDLILRSYGVKSEDGRRFIKSQELRDEFSQTEAYVVLVTELLSSTDAMVAFVNGIIPAGAKPDGVLPIAGQN